MGYLEQRVNKDLVKITGANVPMSEFEKTGSLRSIDVSSIDVPEEHGEILNFIHSSYSLKPKGLVMKELKWKYLIRSVSW